MKVDANIIVTDTKPSGEWKFDIFLEKYTGLKWTTLHDGLQYKIHHKREQLRRYWSFFYFPFLLFLNRKKIKNMIAWQQYYGLFYALYCEIFHVRKCNYCMIMTFIYRERKGIFGKLQFLIIKKIISGKYVDRLIVFSKNEELYYTRLFGLARGKVISSRLGLEDLTEYVKKEDRQNYILAAGRSNRDYEFLIRALKGQPYPVKIVCDQMEALKVENIEIYNDVYYEEFFHMLSECYCVVIPLKDRNISSGQLVILQSMEFSKPIIITDSFAVTDYIQNGENGYIIEKDEQMLRSAIQKLIDDKEEYQNISEAARRSYEKYFSMEALGKQIAEYFLRDRQDRYDI